MKELSMVSSIELMLTWRISSERSSRAEMIFTAWPGIREDFVFKTTFGQEYFTSTSAMADFEFTMSSLALSLEEVEEEGDGSREGAMVGER